VAFEALPGYFSMRVSPKGVLLGAIVDVVTSTLGGRVIVMYIAGSPALTDVPADSRARVITDLMLHRPAFYLAALLVGAVGSILGGYVAARMARHDAILNGALSSFLCVAFGLYELVRSAGGSPLVDILAFVMSPSLGALGGYLRDCQPVPASAGSPANGSRASLSVKT